MCMSGAVRTTAKTEGRYVVAAAVGSGGVELWRARSVGKVGQGRVADVAWCRVPVLRVRGRSSFVTKSSRLPRPPKQTSMAAGVGKAK